MSLKSKFQNTTLKQLYVSHCRYIISLSLNKMSKYKYHQQMWISSKNVYVCVCYPLLWFYCMTFVVWFLLLLCAWLKWHVSIKMHVDCFVNVWISWRKKNQHVGKMFLINNTYIFVLKYMLFYIFNFFSLST